MGSSFGSYEIARSGMSVNERGLYVTGQNIANVNTPGFSRQQSIAQTSNYIGNDSYKQIGLGASVQQTRQIRHQFLDNAFRKENKELGKWEAINKTYIEAQNIIGEPLGEGIQESLNQFWDSWQELSKDPESLTIRALVRQRGQSLSDHINHIGDQFNNLQTNLDNQLVERVSEINDITTNIASLNEQIVSFESCNDRANDLRDQRNLLLDRMSSLINIEVNEHINGSIDVITNGYALVSDKQTVKVLTSDPLNPEVYHTPYLDFKVGGNYLKLTPKSGEINGILESRDRIEKHAPAPSTTKTGIVPTLNLLVKNIVDEVNALHSIGKNISVPNNGINFFENIIINNYGIYKVSINNQINLDLNKITSGGSTATPLDKGDNRGALELAKLRGKVIDNSPPSYTEWGLDENGNPIGNVSIDEFYQQKIVFDIANKAEESSSLSNSQSLLVQSLDNQRNSISAVSMDEEMSYMLKYQFAYGGASKVFNTIDEMIDTIVNRMGLVGR